MHSKLNGDGPIKSHNVLELLEKIDLYLNEVRSMENLGWKTQIGYWIKIKKNIINI